MGLVLHERRAREEVELLHALAGEIAFEGAEEDEVLPKRDGNARLAQRGEELEQHGPITRRVGSRVKRAPTCGGRADCPTEPGILGTSADYC